MDQFKRHGCRLEKSKNVHEVLRLRQKHQNRVPVVVAIARASSEAAPVKYSEKTKGNFLRLLVPNNMTGAGFRKIVHERAPGVRVDRLSICGRRLEDTDVFSMLDEQYCPQRRNCIEVTEMEWLPKEADIDGCSGKAFHLPECDPPDLVSPRTQRDAKVDVAQKLLDKHPDRVPVMCRQASTAARGGAPGLPGIERKMLAPKSMLCRDLKAVIHKQLPQPRVPVEVWDKLSLFAEGVKLDPDSRVAQVYEQHKADDGLLYVAFGSGSAETLQQTAAAWAPAAPAEGDAVLADEGAEAEMEALKEALRKAEEHSDALREEKESTAELLEQAWSLSLKQEQRATDLERGHEEAESELHAEKQRADNAEEMLQIAACEKEELELEKEEQRLRAAELQARLEEAERRAEAAEQRAEAAEQRAERAELAAEFRLQLAEKEAQDARQKWFEREQAALVRAQEAEARAMEAKEHAAAAESTAAALMCRLEEESRKLRDAWQKTRDLGMALQEEAARATEYEQRLALEAEGYVDVAASNASEPSMTTPVGSREGADDEEASDEFVLVDDSDQSFPDEEKD